MVSQFMQTVYVLVTTGHWSELKEFFALMRAMINQPKMVVTPQKPVDKEST